MNVNDYVQINRNVLKWAGLYPVSVLRCYTCLFCLFLIMVPQVSQIYRHLDDMNSVLETSSVLFTIVLTMLKSTVWIMNRRKIELFVDYMLTDYWQLVTSEKAAEYMIAYAIYARNVTKGYVFIICISLIFFFSLPVIDRLILVLKRSKNSTGSKNFPFLAWYPKSYYDFPYYELTYISQILATTICGIMILATDTLIVTALLHTSGHFKVLQKELEHVNTDINRVSKFEGFGPFVHRYPHNVRLIVLMNAGTDSKYYAMHLQTMKSRVRRIIKHHQIVLWFCDNMERNFSPILLLQTLASSLIICLIALQVSTTLTNKANIPKYLSYLIMTLFQLLMFCFPGDVLLQQSFSVSKAAYTVRWYDTDAVHLKAELSLLMLRAQKPSQVTAGGFYVMHLENFNAVLSTAMSYFMMIRNLNM